MRVAMITTMPRTVRLTEDFGPRLRRLRKEPGWTQAELAEKIDSTVRAIFYYEREGRFPAVPVLADLLPGRKSL
jgi:transcriptional regulator with XRE-family HTH domain